MLLGLLGGVLLLSLAQLGYQFLTRSPSVSNNAQSSLSPMGATTDSLRVAIIPFDIIGTGSDTTRTFADSLLDKIVQVLAANQVDTVSRSDSLTLRNGNPGAAAALAALRVGMTLEGSVENDGKTITVRLHLDDVQRHQTLWSKEFQGPVDSPEPLQTQVALHATDVTRWAVSPRLKAIRSDPSLVAAFLEGVEENAIVGGARAIAIARDLVSRAPGFAAAHTLLASTVGRETGLQTVTPDERAETIREAKVAISLDGGDGQAYALLSGYLPDISIIERERLLLKGLSVEPGSPSANWDYAVLILANTGRTADAIAQAQNAWQLAPFTEWVAWSVPLLMGNVGRTDEARAAIAEMKRKWPENPDVVFKAVEFYVESRNPPFARALGLLDDPDLRNYYDRPPFGKPGATDVLRAALQARVGSPEMKQSAAQLIETAVENGTIDASVGVANLTSLGAVEDAFRAAGRILNKSHEQVGIQQGIWVNAYYLFGWQTAELRRDPRFIQLAQRLGLVDYWRATGHWPDFCSEPGLPYDCKAVAARLATTVSPSAKR